MSELTGTTEQLFDLFAAECARKDVTPTISDFSIWLEENGYNDDLSDLYADI